MSKKVCDNCYNYFWASELSQLPSDVYFNRTFCLNCFPLAFKKHNKLFYQYENEYSIPLKI